MNNDCQYTVTVLRLPQSPRSQGAMGTDALNGIGSIPGVTEVEIKSTDDNSVTLSYTWAGSEQFQATDEHLANYGLCRRWKNEE